jgi:hypothetical protein
VRSTPGKLINLAVTITVWGTPIKVQGSVEMLDVRVDLNTRSRPQA